jgi:hypothetical protein
MAHCHIPTYKGSVQRSYLSLNWPAPSAVHTFIYSTVYILLVSRNSSRGRGVIPSLAELGEQFYQLTSAWVLPVWNVASWSVVRCIVRCVAYAL